MNSQTTTALAIALGAALTLTSLTAAADDMTSKEKCFGVAMKGKNDCKAGAGTTCAGSSSINDQPNSFKLVPAGTCEKTKSTTSPTGFGQLQAFMKKDA